MRKCCIFGALPPGELFYAPDEDDLVIAADRGLEALVGLEIKPDAVIGDFDSLGYVPAGDNVVKLPVQKDDTDIGYAIKYAFSKGFDDFIIYGGIGGLIDHTLANIQLCVYISKRGGRAVFVGDGAFITAVTDGTLSLNGMSGRFSVLSADTVSTGVSVTGAAYCIRNALLRSDFPLGVSNEFSGDTASISVEKGTLVIITSAPVDPFS